MRYVKELLCCMIRKIVKTIRHSYQDELNFDYLRQVNKTKAGIKNDLLNHATKHKRIINL